MLIEKIHFEGDFMSKCYAAPYIMPAANMGKENPLPDIKNVSYIHAGIETTEKVREKDKTYINCGMIPTMLPYRQQDGYDRDRKDTAFTSVVLENEHLKAVFLPELGGRLWSLFDKDAGKELLYCNPVFQPGNLALRNAWFSGGVEFNVSIKGHNPLTCDPLFAQKITLSDGSEGLRMFEYERIRGVLYTIDAWIPEGGKMLYIRPRIENRTGKEIWMYWWSNIATPTVEKCRVIVPAEDTFINYFGNDHYILDFGKHDGCIENTDVSYPENLGRSLDFFYYIEDNDPKWITAVDKDGYGLIQCSTRELKGRKLFLWGEGAGGKNWNRFLTDGSNPGYIEIQAGLARTQLEHIPMPAGDVWTWVEGYGAANLDEAHGSFKAAQASVCRQLDETFPEGMTETLDKAKTVTATAGDFFLFGSGWGVLEEHKRAAEGGLALSADVKLPEGALTPAQKEWLVLLETGALPEADVKAEPKGYVVDEFWREKLAASIEKPENRNWYALMHMAVMEYAKGNVDGALKLFEESAATKENAWSFRNLAMIYRNEYKDVATALGFMEKAFALCKNCRGILVDTATTYLAAGEYEKWLEAFEQIGEFKTDGRLQLHKVSALIALGRYDEAKEILNPSFKMPDIKEADSSLSDIWFALYGKYVTDETGVTDPAEVKRLVEEKYPLGDLDFRTH